MGTLQKALIRTIAFGDEEYRTINVFDRDIELLFNEEGQFFWVYPDGNWSVVPIPEPGTFLPLGTVLLGLVGCGIRKGKARKAKALYIQ